MREAACEQCGAPVLVFRLYAGELRVVPVREVFIASGGELRALHAPDHSVKRYIAHSDVCRPPNPTNAEWEAQGHKP